MKKFKFLKSLLATLPIIGTLPVVLSSCSLKDYFGSIDGLTWTGRTSGFFQAQDYTIDTKAKTITYNNGADIKATNLVVPDYVFYKFKKLKVILGKGCFLNNIGIIGTVTLNSFTDTVVERCFENCTSLTGVTFKRRPRIIEKRAFKGCVLLEDINVLLDDTIYKNWAISLEYIGDFAFANCIINTPYLVFGSNIQYIGQAAFHSCFSIVEVNMQLCSIKFLSPSIFYNCFGLEKIYLPQSIESIGDKAFAQCTYLEKIFIPKPEGDNFMNISLGISAFQNCIFFTGFSNDFKLTSIGASCFDNAVSINFLPWTYTKGDDIIISERAFYGCSFEKISFTTEMKDVEDFAFASCGHLTMLDFRQTPWESIVSKWTGSWIFEDAKTIGTVLLPKEDEDKYDEQWRSFLGVQGIRLNQEGESGFWNIRYE